MPKVENIRGLNLPGTPWATSACRGVTLLFFLTTKCVSHTRKAKIECLLNLSPKIECLLNLPPKIECLLNLSPKIECLLNLSPKIECLLNLPPKIECLLNLSPKVFVILNEVRLLSKSFYFTNACTIYLFGKGNIWA